MEKLKKQFICTFPIIIISLFFVLYFPKNDDDKINSTINDTIKKINNDIIYNEKLISISFDNINTVNLVYQCEDKVNLQNLKNSGLYKNKSLKCVSDKKHCLSIRNCVNEQFFRNIANNRIDVDSFQTFTDVDDTNNKLFQQIQILKNEDIFFDIKSSLKLSNLHQVFFVFILSLILLCTGKKIVFNPKLLPLYTLFLFSIVTAFFSQEQQLSLKRIIITFLPMLIISNFYSNYENIDKLVKKFIDFFLIFTFLLCFYSIIVFIFDKSVSFIYEFNGISFIDNKYIPLGQFYSVRPISISLFNFKHDFFIPRPSSLFTNTIGFSHIILVACLFSIYKFFYSKKQIFIYLTIFFVLMLFWSMTRTTIIIFLIVFPLFLYNFISYKKLISFLLIVFSISTILIFFLNFDKLTTDYPRVILYQFLISKYKDYFFTGYGFGVSNEVFFKNYISLIIEKYSSLDIILDEEFKNISIPSVTLTILMELGFFGFILLLAYITLPIYLNKINNKQVNIIIIVSLGLFLTQIFDISLFRFHPTSFLFAFFIGALCNNNFKHEKHLF